MGPPRLSEEIDAVLLDAGGVLTLPAVELVRDALSQAGARPSARTLDHAHYLAIPAYDRSAGEGDGHEAFLAAYVQAAGVPPARVKVAAKRLAEALKAEDNPWSRVRPGVRPGLRAICASGATVVIVSNSDGTVERSLLALGVCQVGPGSGAQVAAVLDSAVVGHSKPDRRIFRLALSKAGVTAGRAVHVGDSVRADVEGARAAGIRPVHFDPHGLCRASDHEHAASLLEVARLVRRSRRRPRCPAGST
jgi:putative hydrolase of the HAD superfamily